MYTGGDTRNACAGPSADPKKQPNNPYPSMWIRDGSASLYPYISIFSHHDFIKKHPYQSEALRNIYRGYIYRIANDLIANPYEHSFNQDGSVNDQDKGFELDSPSYFVWISYHCWKVTGDTTPFTQYRDQNDEPLFLKSLQSIVQSYQLFQKQQKTDLKKQPLRKITYTGMISTQARPSDDYALMPFNIADNFFAIEALHDISNMAPKIYPNNTQALKLKRTANRLAKAIKKGIKRYGVYQLNGKKIYAYEVDGPHAQSFIADGKTNKFSITKFAIFQRDNDPSHKKYQDTQFRQNPAKSIQVRVGNKVLSPITDYSVTIDRSNPNDATLTLKHAPKMRKHISVSGNYLLMDDANLPNLLSLPNYGGKNNKLYRNTRAFVLSTDNPFYYTASKYSGEGSPHEQDFDQMPQNIWPLGLVAQGATATNATKQDAVLNMLLNASSATKSIECTNAQNYMYESFNANDPNELTRGWFVWANATFSRWVTQLAQQK